MMLQTNPTENFRQHHLAPLREDQESEKVERRVRVRHSDPAAVLERPDEESWLQFLWSTGPAL